MKIIDSLTVKYHDRVVGTLAETKDGMGAFQYDREWLQNGFSISPLSLPLEERVFVPKSDTLEGMFGAFADSLPDGWGRLLVDRVLLSKGISPPEVHPIERLGIVGNMGMGALEYNPQILEVYESLELDLDQISRECKEILNEEKVDNLDTLFVLGGSSGGARPKVLTSVDGEPWIVKFASRYDRRTIGEEEYRYMECARQCGIHVPEVRLFPSKYGKGYFGVKRFDREANGKIHMLTVSGLLEISHRTPNLDYNDLMKLTYILTKDSRQLEQMYRRMCFNVYAHNRDDHSKNFSFLYDEEQEEWMLSPVYDLTYSHSIRGEHATCVNGNGKNPAIEDLIEVGKAAGMTQSSAEKTAKQIEEIVIHELKDILDSY